MVCRGFLVPLGRAQFRFRVVGGSFTPADSEAHFVRHCGPKRAILAPARRLGIGRGKTPSHNPKTMLRYTIETSAD